MPSQSRAEPEEPQSTIRLSMGFAEWAMILTLSLLWGGSFFFVGVAVDALPTLTIVVLRVGLAALTLWAVIALLGRPVPRSAAVWAAFFGMGLLNNVVPFGLIVWGQHTIASGLASILNATTPLFGVVVAGLLLPDERITALKLTGVVVGFLGVVVMVGVDALSGLTTGVLAEIAILGAALSYAFAGVFGRRFKRLGVDPIVTAAGQVTASTVLLMPAAVLVDRPWALSIASTATWAAIVALAVLSTAFAYILYFQILERAGAINLLLVTFLIPGSAVLLGSLVLGERLEWVHPWGMALIGLGLAAIDGRLFKRRVIRFS
jgi:drug/metabolite transporter (DMT)-like permease